MPKHPDYHLTARTDIGKYRRGDHIEDHAAVDAILKGEHRAHFVRVAADNTPQDKAEIAAAKAEADRKAAADKAVEQHAAAKAPNPPVEKPEQETKR